MLEDSQQTPLEQEPIKVMYGMNQRTKLQKDREELNMAIIEQDIKDRGGEKPPKEYLRRQYFEERVYGYYTDEQIQQMTAQSNDQEQKENENENEELQQKQNLLLEKKK